MSWTQERARVASLTRSRAADDPELVAARRNLKAERMADFIRRQLDTWPPLTIEQRESVAALLRPTAGGAGDAAQRVG